MRPNAPSEDYLRYKFLLSDNTAGVTFLFGSAFKFALDGPAERIAAEYTTQIDKVLDEFRRFLAIKVFTSDGDGRKIGPTPLMDAIWRVAILDTCFYRDLQFALDLTLDYRPSAVPRSQQETADAARRLSAMEVAYRGHFQCEPRVDPRTILRGGATQVFDIRVSTANSNVYVLTVTLATTVKAVKDLLAIQTGKVSGDHMLMFAGHVLQDRRDLLDYLIVPNSMVHIAMIMRGPVSR
ncbi:hypothetical protein VTL71DRAFT_14118 [Oculimacula yallundae]|uniref:Ubiquitin-like domain-containing protein n=1 Tax=Oculimacula yallundae TaxID=86028 RepID=A0ABR4CJX4_9HELO